MGTANRPLTVGFLGTGYIADWHAKALRSVPNASLTAVCDRDDIRVRAFAARHGINQTYTSLAAMLCGSELDVIHVLLPPELHAQSAFEIIQAGIHVLLEKPMAICHEECTRLIDEARSRNVRIGVSHNFLFAPIYEQLKGDLKSGKLGRPDRVTIIWNKGLGQLQTGPLNHWMFREPQNIVLEVGPHSVAQMLDLVGSLEITCARASNRVTLTNGAAFYRRWHVEAGQAQTSVMLEFSFAPGYTEHSIHVRGSLASAIADFEHNTYVLRERTKFGPDFDSFCATVFQAKAVRSQAWSTLRTVAISKLGRSTGGPYGQSIAKAVQSFYANLTTSLDARLSPEFGSEVVRTCILIGEKAGVQESEQVAIGGVLPASTVHAASEPVARPEVLVLGATGFIGQELTRQLVDRGIPIRLMVRNSGRLPQELRARKVHIAVGDLSSDSDIIRALDGIRVVYHLARPHVTTWEDYIEHEVEVTRRVANACVAAKVERLIYTGTIDCFYAGSKAGIITENTPLDPHIEWRNYYARAKALSEQILISIRKEYGLGVVIFRPGIVIGLGSSPFHWGVGMWSWNAVCQVWGKGRNPLPLVLVEDVGQALVTALDQPGIEGECFNLVADAQLNAVDYLQALEEFTGSRFQKIMTPPWKFYVVDVLKWIVKRVIRHPDRRRPSYRDWESRTQLAHYDCSKARRLLNWKPTETQTEILYRGIQLPAQAFLN
jgi:predicted dehydrogenase/nucleoside-diphosphate-sugar epimerase